MPALLKKNNCCSRACQHKLHSKQMAGEGNPKWVDGRAVKPYHKGWTFNLKNKIKKTR